MSRVVIAHPGRAAYPEVAAYGQFLTERGYEVCIHNERSKKERPAGDVYWHIMGVVPRRPSGGFVVHDYRSLSVGSYPSLRDAAKRVVNAKPDLRIFQNQAIRELMGFSDQVPSILLPMGVPKDVFQVSSSVAGVEPETFCYMGSMTRERGFQQLLEAFRVYSAGTKAKLILLGNLETSLAKEVDGSANIEWLGNLMQHEAWGRVVEAEFSLCFFPRHRPHLYQVPTKLLEYGALGCRIIANEHPMTRRTADTYDIPAYYSGDFLFDKLDIEQVRALALPNREKLAVLEWTNVISRSGVEGFLAAI